MRFELTVALKYLIPRWRQLSVSIISLLSILVISMVVWLVVLFLSVTEGIEKRWIDELVTFSAPVKMVPTESYFRSYFYQVDNHSINSDYNVKTIGEKLASRASDPYDPSYDSELPTDFPPPDQNADGSLKDPVKGAWEAISSLSQYGPRPQEYEVTFGNLRLNLFRNDHETFLSQVSYVSSFDTENRNFQKMLIPFSSMDYQNLLHAISLTEDQEADASLKQNLALFFKHLNVTKLQTSVGGFVLPTALYPLSGVAVGIGLIRGDEIYKIILPVSAHHVDSLEKRLINEGHKTTKLHIRFENGQCFADEKMIPQAFLALDENIHFQAEVVEASLQSAQDLNALKFQVKSSIQNIDLSGIVPLRQLEISEIQTKSEYEDQAPFWIYKKHGKYEIPESSELGSGMLVSKHFQNNGVRLGDRGYLSYYSPTASSMQEQRIAVYVAGFYDPGMLPIGSKLLFVDPKVTALLRNELTISDNMLGNGINIWLDNVADAQEVKQKLVQILEEKGIGKYWQVQSFHDYEFSRPILEQLNSDKNLFTLIAVIILIVACSNVISMLILLVNDKRKEIGIMQSMGASPKRIAAIFGICGFTTGLISSILGITAAVLTLHYLQSLVDFLSFMQGHEVFQTAFYGHKLPNQISYHALFFVTIATLSISLLAGIIPAIKAARIRPSDILRSE